MAETHEGYLLIADITGYTQYLSASELEHAEQILTVLLKLMREHTRPPLIISRLEGDAVISYGLRDRFFHGQTFVEVTEETYVAFRKAIERLVLNNTCRCNACANISSLDLKFFIHYGTFVIQDIGGHDELIGSDVVQIHRLVKNRVQESTGVRAYTLWTDAAVRQLGLDNIQATMISHHENYDHLGDIQVWVQDMHPVWERKRRIQEVSIPPNRVTHRTEIELPISPELLWDYLTRLDYRAILLGSDRTGVTNTTSGRVGQGSVYQCYHGNQIIPQAILEWQPFQRILLQTQLPKPVVNTTVLTEYRLEPTEAGTRLVVVDSKPDGPPLGRALFSLMDQKLARLTRQQLELFKARIENELSQRRDEPGRPAELDEEALRQAASASLAQRSI